MAQPAAVKLNASAVAAINPGAKLVTQPKFAEQITAAASPVGAAGNGGALQKGYMIWERPSPLYSGGGPLGDGRDVINFLFNPSTVSTDYNVGNASLQSAMMYPVAGDSGTLLAPLSQTVSWQLYFDRTFELLYGTPSSAVNDPSVIGVQADVYQFMQFTGVLASLTSQEAIQVLGQPSGGGSAPTTGGIMMMMPAYVYFGNAASQANNQLAAGGTAQFAAVSTQLAFYGFISEWSVEYTHWTTSMVPIRAVVSVSFTMLPAPAATDPNAQATWKDAATLQGNYTSGFLSASVTSVAQARAAGG